MPDSVNLDGRIRFADHAPFVLIGGVNVIESEGFVMEGAASFVEVTRALGIPYVFKASFDKASRPSIRSFRGHRLVKSLAPLATA